MLIIGLGNPEKKYENTYHNVGFMVADRIASFLGASFKTKECKALTASLYKAGERIVIAKPQTYMNLSGEAVRELMGKYREDTDTALVIYDDIDLPAGAVRARKEGSAGTHNGMRNIVALTGTKAIPRVRMGIGKPEPPMQLVDYVLAKISGDNKIAIDAAIDKAARAVSDYISHKDFDRLMRDCNA